MQGCQEALPLWLTIRLAQEIAALPSHHPHVIGSCYQNGSAEELATIAHEGRGRGVELCSTTCFKSQALLVSSIKINDRGLGACSLHAIFSLFEILRLKLYNFIDASGPNSDLGYMYMS